MTDAPDPSVTEALRREAYEEIGRMAFVAEEFAQKLFDAAEALDRMATAVRLQQLRFSVMAAIQTFNLVLRKLDGQDVPAGGPPRSDCADQRTGDVVA